MYCPECGSKADEDAKFCYNCGANFNENSDTDTFSDYLQGQYKIQEPKPRPPNKKAIQALIVVTLLLSAGAFGFIYWMIPDKNGFESNEFILYGDGGVGSGIISIAPHLSDVDYTDDSATMTFTCNVNTLGNYQWGLRSLDESKYYVDEDASANSGYAVFERVYDLPEDTTFSNDRKSMTCTLDPGYYSVRVDVNFQQYEGTFALEGEVTRSYSWDFTQHSRPSVDLVKNKHSFEMDFSFQYSECISAIEYGGLRGYIPFTEMGQTLKTYVTKDSNFTTKLEEGLRVEYEEEGLLDDYLEDDSYNYASYLLTFVQLNIRYYPSELPEEEIQGLNYNIGSDYMIYGSEEYWAFPTQTIMQGVGDCEDTAFLTAALFKAAGLDAAVAIIPGHAVAGIHMENDLKTEPSTYPIYPPTPQGAESREYLISQEIGEKTYYGCETTTSYQYLIGYTNIMHPDESGDEQKLTHWIPEGDEVSETYGFYEV
ncbi:MAG TPA: zinc ribbon domain-containing protein [Candidatus Methanomethylophilaceae archaeon]|nr:zinc ribbon domain-containing protein [Candidatus Methanomethylophilaceae archaeon]